MFEWLTKFDKIIVTGPHRSGTRICAQMTADDTGYEYIDEDDINWDSLFQMYWLLTNKQRLVIQCPALCRHVHMFSDNKTVIILMRRNIEDIIASRQRINWQWEKVQLARYDQMNGMSPKAVYRFWEEHQKGKIRHAVEVEYESLTRHPLWVPKPLRRDFKPKQTVPQGRQWEVNAYPYPRSSVRYWNESDRARIIFKGDTAKELNATGQFIWRLCDGTHSHQEILEALKEKFGGVERNNLEHDLDSFLNTLVDSGFLWFSSKGKV